MLRAKKLRFVLHLLMTGYGNRPRIFSQSNLSQQNQRRFFQVTWSEGVPAIRLLPKALTKMAYDFIIIPSIAFMFGLTSRTKIRKVFVHADCRPVRGWGGRCETGRSSCTVGTCRSGLGFRWWKQLELSFSAVCLWGSFSGSLQTVKQPCGLCGARRLCQRPCQTTAGSLCNTHWETSWGSLCSVF